MKEAELDLWTTPADALCITTNGSVKTNGHGVMGRGCAAEAATLRGHLPAVLGTLVRRYGNHVHVLDVDIAHRRQLLDLPTHWLSFPVKHEWDQRASLLLIEQSARELMAIVQACGWDTVLLPRPGCGNGRLNWPDVRRVLTPILDDRITVVSK